MLLLIPGPVQTRPEVKAAMAQDIAPWDRDFQKVYARIRERIVGVAGGTPGVHATLPIQGAGHFVSEAALRTFVAPGAKVLIPMNGAYAQRMARLAREAGRVVVELALPDTRGATAADIMPVLDADPSIGTVAMVFNETGSGIVNDAEGIGRALHAAGKRLILDAVSAFGALPFLAPLAPAILAGRPFRVSREGLERLALHDLARAEKDELLPDFVAESGRLYREILFGRARLPAGAVRCPVLVVHGAADRLVPLRVARGLARRWRGELAIIPNHGHWLVAGSLAAIVLPVIGEWIDRAVPAA